MDNTTADKTDTLLSGSLMNNVSSLRDSLAGFDPLNNESTNDVSLVSPSNASTVSPSNVLTVPTRPDDIKSVKTNSDTNASVNHDLEINSVDGDSEPSASFKFSVVDPFHGDDPFSDFATECKQFNQIGMSSSVSLKTSEGENSGHQDFVPFGLNKDDNRLSVTSDISTQSSPESDNTVHNPGYACTRDLSGRTHKREPLYATIDDLAVDNHTVDNTPIPNSRKISGYLYKQGGVKANKGWRKRWIVFNGKDVRYYDNSTSQVSKRIVPLTRMVKVNVIDSDKKRFRFDLETKFRTFLFAAESTDDRFMWTKCLREAIIHYSPPPEGEVEGGDMSNPDMKGYVKFQKEKNKYVALKLGRLCYYDTEQDFKFASPIHEVEMKLASVKSLDENKLQISTHYSFHICLVFGSRAECALWRKMIEQAISIGLEEDNTNVYEVADEPK